MSYKTSSAQIMEKQNDKRKDEAKASANEKNDNTTRITYISQKTQRLAGALYAITKVFPSDEPLKTTLRNQALSLVSSAHMLSEGTPASDSVIELPALLNRLRSQLAVARDGGLISQMNFAVLDEEIEKFIGEIREVGAFPGPHLSNSFFNKEAPALAAGESGRNISAGGSSSVSEHGGGLASDSGASSDGGAGEKQALSAKDKRRQKILDLFDDKTEITVNDVTDVINGYSTKTIQRDLKALVKNGKLEKHGKRRWTSYTRA